MQLRFGDKREVGEEYVGVLPVTKKEGKQKGKRASALGWKMDTQTINKIEHL